MFSTTTRIGILGGGQLGKMLCLAAAPWDLKTFVLDASPDCPAAQVCTGFTAGDFNRYDDVLTVLTRSAEDPAKIDLERAAKAAARARERMRLQASDVDQARAVAALRRALMREKVARRRV